MRFFRHAVPKAAPLLVFWRSHFENLTPAPPTVCAKNINGTVIVAEHAVKQICKDRLNRRRNL